MLTAQMILDMIEEKNGLAEAAIETLAEAVESYANAEKDYRETRGKAIITYGAESDPLTGKKRTGQAIDALIDADGGVLNARLTRDIAEGMKQVAVEEVRLRTTQVSAAQTVAGAFKSEANYERTRVHTEP